jgi:hypothetical protein
MSVDRRLSEYWRAAQVIHATERKRSPDPELTLLAKITSGPESTARPAAKSGVVVRLIAR